MLCRILIFLFKPSQNRCLPEDWNTGEENKGCAELWGQLRKHSLCCIAFAIPLAVLNSWWLHYFFPSLWHICLASKMCGTEFCVQAWMYVRSRTPVNLPAQGEDRGDYIPIEYSSCLWGCLSLGNSSVQEQESHTPLQVAAAHIYNLPGVSHHILSSPSPRLCDHFSPYHRCHLRRCSAGYPGASLC